MLAGRDILPAEISDPVATRSLRLELPIPAQAKRMNLSLSHFCAIFQFKVLAFRGWPPLSNTGSNPITTSVLDRFLSSRSVVGGL